MAKFKAKKATKKAPKKARGKLSAAQRAQIARYLGGTDHGYHSLPA